MHASALKLNIYYREGSQEAWANQNGHGNNNRWLLNENELEVLSVQLKNVKLED